MEEVRIGIEEVEGCWVEVGTWDDEEGDRGEGEGV